MYDWERGVFEAIFEGEGDIAAATSLDGGDTSQRRVGGPVDLKPGETLQVPPSLRLRWGVCCLCCISWRAQRSLWCHAQSLLIPGGLSGRAIGYRLLVVCGQQIQILKNRSGDADADHAGPLVRGGVPGQRGGAQHPYLQVCIPNLGLLCFIAPISCWHSVYLSRWWTMWHIGASRFVKSNHEPWNSTNNPAAKTLNTRPYMHGQTLCRVGAMRPRGRTPASTLCRTVGPRAWSAWRPGRWPPSGSALSRATTTPLSTRSLPSSENIHHQHHLVCA